VILTDDVEVREGESPPDQRERPAPVGMRPNIRAVKEAVGIERVAADYGRFRPSGAGRLQGRCVSPNHEDRTPSMTIYTSDGRFKCFGCGAHGDVIDLVVLVEGCELWEALVLLGNRYGIDLPGRPESWHRKQERQKSVRDGLEAIRARSLRRQMFRMFEPMLAGIPDEAERAREAEYVWSELTPLAVRMVEERRA